MNYFDHIIRCDKKKVNRIGGMGRFGGGGGRIQNNRPRDRDQPKIIRKRKVKPGTSDLISYDAEKAPVEKSNMCVWKWDITKDCYDYSGCNQDLEISQGLPINTMDNFFIDIMYVDNYRHSELVTYIDYKFWLWSCLCYIPFFICSFIFADVYWGDKNKELLAKRKSQIEVKMKEYKEKILNPINSHLQLRISTHQGVIILINENR